MAFSLSLSRQPRYILQQVLHPHYLLVQSRYSHQVNVKAREISANLLGHNTWHVYDSLHSIKGERNFTMQARVPHQFGQKVGLQLSLVSPGIILEPYKPLEPISFLQRWFTRRGWKRTKEALMSELKSAYAIAKLRKLAGYSKPKFYQEAIQHYKEINKYLSHGDRTSLRKLVTENMYSKFAAYNLKGNLVAGDINAKVLVRDVWVFERSLFQPGARWRLCGRISL